MSKTYNDVEVSPEVMSELDNSGLPAVPETQTTTSVAEDTTDKTSEPVEEVIESIVDGIEIDGENYDLDTVKAWMDDSNNKSEWQKSNTKKSQQLSQWNKLVEHINDDDDFKEHIKDYFFDNPDEAEKLGLDGKFPTEVSKEPSEIEQRLESLEGVENDRVIEQRVEVLDAQLSEIESTHPDILNEDSMADFLDFAEKNTERFSIDGMPSMVLAFKEWSYDAVQEQLIHYKQLVDNKGRNSGKVISTSEIGAKETKTPSRYKSYKQIGVDDPEIAEYFK